MIPRSSEKELLDIQQPPLPELRSAMLHLAKTNRLFLNNWLVARYVRKLIGEQNSASILDIGTGIGDLPKYLVEVLRREGKNITATGIDINPDVLTLAREYTQGTPNLNIREQNLRDIPDHAYTVATMSQMLHHLSPEEAPEFLRAAYRKVTRGIVISDFIRSRFGYYLAKWSIALTNPHRFNASDGPLSILRSYTDQEIAGILKQAGIDSYKIYNFLIRKIVVIKK